MMKRRHWLILVLGTSLQAAPSPAADFSRVYEIDELKSTEAALSYLDRMPLEESQRFEGGLLRGVLLDKLGRTSEARKTFEQLDASFPGQPEPRHNLAILEARSGQHASAARTLEEILASFPSYDSARTNLERIRAVPADGDESDAGEALALRLSVRPEIHLRAAPSPPTSSEATEVARPEASGPMAASEPSAGVSEGDTRGELERVVAAWSKAWSQQRIRDYLSHYSSGFRPADGSTRAAWEAQRRRRVATPSSIEVEIDFDTLEVWPIGPDEMGVRFIQRYRSDRYADTVRKTLGLVRENGAWRITSEISR